MMDDIPDLFEDDGTLCAYPSTEDWASFDEAEVPEKGASYGRDADGRVRNVWEALYSVRDPEMPISIVDLGLVYDVRVDEPADRVAIEWTVTYSGCPAKSYLKRDIRAAVQENTAFETIELHETYDPEWSVAMVSPRGKEKLREFGLSI